MGNLKRNPRLTAQVLAVLLRRLGAVNGRALTITKDELPSNPHAIISRFVGEHFQISYEDTDKDSIEATERSVKKSAVLNTVWKNDDTKRYVPRAINGGPAWLIYDQREERHLENEDELYTIDPRAPLNPLTVN